MAHYKRIQVQINKYTHSFMYKNIYTNTQTQYLLGWWWLWPMEHRHWSIIKKIPVRIQVKNTQPSLRFQFLAALAALYRTLVAHCVPLLNFDKKSDFWYLRSFRHLITVMSRQKDKKTKYTKRQKYKKIKDKDQKETLNKILWRQGSFALLCFSYESKIDFKAKNIGQNICMAHWAVGRCNEN